MNRRFLPLAIAAGALLLVFLIYAIASAGRSDAEERFLGAATADAPGISEDALLQGGHDLCDADTEQERADALDFIDDPATRLAVAGDAIKYLCPIGDN